MHERISDKFNRPIVPDSIKVFPSDKLNGRVAVPGDKVAAVHLLLATATLNTKSKINNIHYCGDVLHLIDWMQSVDLTTTEQYQGFLSIIPKDQERLVDLSDLASTRSNICLVSALALKHEKVLFKGTKGCNFANRKVDKHFALMESFGLSVEEKDNLYEITRSELSEFVNFDCSTEEHGSSVGVTCHALIASLVYPNKITLTNVALEAAPMTLVKYVKKSTNRNVDVDGRTIIIEAVDRVEYKPNEVPLPPDITVACTYIAALISVGEGAIELENISLEEIPHSVLVVYKEMGVDMSEEKLRRLRVKIGKNGINMPEEIICDVIPGFPTDVGPILSASIAGVDGTASITDYVYDKRSSHVDGLNRMGYDLETEGNKITVNGRAPEKKGEVTVEAKDIRAGAALVVGALGSNSEGIIITNYNQVYRGYASLVEDLQILGAKIESI